MAGLLIIGVGNPLRGDDGVGFEAATSLQKLAGDGITVLSAHQLAPEMAQDLSEAELALIIDASVDLQPGEIRWRKLAPGAPEPQPLSHHVSPSSLLDSALKLFGRSPDCYIAEIGVECFDYGAGLSPRVAQSLSLVLDAVHRLVRGDARAIINSYTHIDS